MLAANWGGLTGRVLISVKRLAPNKVILFRGVLLKCLLFLNYVLSKPAFVCTFLTVYKKRKKGLERVKLTACSDF